MRPRQGLIYALVSVSQEQPLPQEVILRTIVTVTLGTAGQTDLALPVQLGLIRITQEMELVWYALMAQHQIKLAKNAGSYQRRRSLLRSQQSRLCG